MFPRWTLQDLHQEHGLGANGAALGPNKWGCFEHLEMFQEFADVHIVWMFFLGKFGDKSQVKPNHFRQIDANIPTLL